MRHRVIGRYELLEVLGVGGMGVVYRARDTRLARDVAVKLIPPELLANQEVRARLRREALTLSKLNHPYIASIHDFDTIEGIDVLVMEYVPGETLASLLQKGPLPIADVLHIGREILEALEEAHEIGIIHRDLKPANIVVTPKGNVKLLDFGLAKLLPPIDAGLTRATTLTETGVTVGTIPYMPPEQLRGQGVDARSDLYSAGAVLYEMTTGQRAFAETQMPALIAAIINRPVTPPASLNAQLDPDLEAVILKALAKNQNDRYQSARALLEALRPEDSAVGSPRAPARRGGPRVQHRGLTVGILSALVLLTLAAIAISSRERFLGTSGAKHIRSLAVLPLRNLTGDPDLEYLADGTTDQLISDLAQIDEVRVISFTSMMRYKMSGKGLRDIAKELNVDAVIEGSLGKSGDRMRINAKLIEADSERYLMVESFEGQVGDALELQREVAQSVAERFRIKLSLLTSRPRSEVPVDHEAYGLYLQGRHFWNMRTEQGLRKGLEYFARAAQIDTTFALAYVGIADSYNLFERYGVLPPREAFPQAKAAAKRALAIQPLLGEAHASLAFAEFLYDWDWSRAQRHFEDALRLSPNYATAHHWYSVYLRAMGDSTAARREAGLALGLDPLSGIVQSNLGDTYFYAAQFPEAVAQYRATLELERDYIPALCGLAYASLYVGKPRDSLEYARQARAADSSSVRAMVAEAFALAAGDQSAEARESLRALEALAANRYVSRVELARIQTALGDEAGAIEQLRQAYAARDAELVYLKVDPRFASIRSDSHFESLLGEIGLAAQGQ